MKRKQTSDLSGERIWLRESEDEVSVFQKRERGHEKRWGIVAVLFMVYAAVFVVSLLFLVEYSLTTTRWQFSAAYVLRIIRQNISNMYLLLTGSGAAGAMEMQVIRYLIVGLIGASLAACGALMQGTFRNVLAGPSTLGVQSGGTLGNMIYVLVFCTSTEVVTVYSYDDIHEIAQSLTFWERNLQQMLVLAGCFGGVLLVLTVALIAGRGKVSSSAMVLAGCVFSSVIGSFCGLIQYYIIVKNPSDSRIEELRSLSMGSLDRAYSWEHLLSMSAILIPCMLILALISGKMDLFLFGDEAAVAMGLAVRRYKLVMMVVSTVMTAVVTAYVGHIGLIGFMTPQIVRRAVGPKFRRLFPASVAMGAILLTVIYDAARVVGMTDSLNLFTSVIGSIAMLFVLLNRKQPAPGRGGGAMPGGPGMGGFRNG